MKTLIGVLASHDNYEANKSLSEIFNTKEFQRLFARFRFVFTNGTYERLFNGRNIFGHQDIKPEKYSIHKDVQDFLHKECGIIRLPSTEDGGVIMLSHLITQRKISIIWPFLSPNTTHLLFPVNLALLRLSDQWHVKKFMNKRSVEEWLLFESDQDANLNKQSVPINIVFSGSGLKLVYKKASRFPNQYSVDPWPIKKPLVFTTKEDLSRDIMNMVVALISHDEMKHRMLDFVTDYEMELFKFNSIIATGTTGKLIEEVSPKLSKKIKRYHSGPKGGDIEIASEILSGGCQLVIFFVDPLHSHPHIEDVRVVIGASMINDQVRMLCNEVQARDWMNRLVRSTT
ncbi:methylglyoxal synthase [bacterium]|nr:MAG: methylglyoxal synthase [bacterium]